MNIGTLDFEIIGKNDGIKQALEEAKESIANFTETAAAGSAGVGDAMQAAAATIEQAWGQLDAVGETNRQQLKELEAEYAQVGHDAAAAFNKATAAGDKEYRTLASRQKALAKEISQRKSVLSEVNRLSGELNKEEQAFKKLATETQKNESRTTSFKAQLRQLTQEMAMQEAEARNLGGETAVYALRATDAFKQMQMQAAQLTDAMADAQQQAKLLSHDNAGLQGVISALGGVAGAFSVAQGVMGLYSGENENLQKIMLKVQSIMAITMGLQQVSNVLNKDSAASLTIFNKAREAFVMEMQRGNAALAKDTAQQHTNTAAKKLNTAATQGQAAAEGMAASGNMKAATGKNLEAAANIKDTKSKIANTIATGASTVAVKGLQKANIMLAATFKAVGAAIKAVPVIGWILAAVSALISIIQLLGSSSREAKKEQEEYYKSVAEGAAEPVSRIEKLSAAWNRLGNDMEAKKKFVDDNKAAFEELGIKVNSVEDAENALVKNKEAFIAAQIAKAKALAATQKAAELYQEALEQDLNREQMQYGSKDYDESLEKATDAEKKAEELIRKSLDAEAEGARLMNEAGIAAAKTYEEGTIGYYEQIIEKKKAALKELANPKDYENAQKEIEALQKSLDAITGTKKRSSSGTAKDPFKEKLDKQRQQYTQYAKWRNSTDEILQKAAATQFKDLLKQGDNYLDYLRQQREKLMAEMQNGGTAAQRKNLATLNQAIAEETKETVLEQFEQELNRQLNGANSLLEKLTIIEKKRRELNNDNSELDNAEKELLQKQREQLINELETQYKAAQREYYDYLESRLTTFERYQNEMAELEAKLAKTNNSTEIAAIMRQMEILQQRQKTYETRTYDALLESYGDFNAQKAALDAEFAEKRRIAQLNGDKTMLDALDKEYKQKLSKLARELMKSPLLEKFTKEADKMTLSEVDMLIDEINNKSIELSENLTDEDIEKLLKSLRDLRREIADRNPFTKLANAAKEFAEEASDASLNRVLKAGSELAENFRQITDCMRQIGEMTGNNDLVVAADAMDDIIGNFQAAEQGAEAWGGWWGAIIGGVTDMIPKIIKWCNYNEELNDKLTETNAKVKELEEEYEELERILKRTYNSGRYALQQQEIANLEAQKKQLEEAIAEMDKHKDDKGFDQEQYDALKQQLNSVRDKLADAYDSLAEDLTQTTIPDIQEEIKDALVNAFAAGASDAEIDKAIEAVANKLMKEAALKMLQTKYLADAVQRWYNEFEAAMADEILDSDEEQMLHDHMREYTEEFKEKMRLWNEMWGDAEDTTNTLSGAIKGASQESIDLLAGYTNATRIIEQSQLDVLTRQLSYVASIDARLERAVAILETMNRSERLTPQATQYDEAVSQRAYGIIDEEI